MPVEMTPISGGSVDLFVSLEEAMEYFTTRWRGLDYWTPLTDTQRTAAIKTAELDLSLYYSLTAGDAAHKICVIEQALFRVMDAGSDIRAAVQAQGVKQTGLADETYWAPIDGAPICAYCLAVFGYPTAWAGVGTALLERDETQ